MKKYLEMTALFFTVCALLYVAPPALAAQDDEVKTTIDAYVQEHTATTAAVSVAVFEGEKVLSLDRYGDADRENGVKNDENTVFEWGSCTKLLVWASAMQLSERGMLDLNEDIRTYLPEGFLTKLSYDAPITMQNLMNHDAGFQETIVELFVPEGRPLRSLEAQLVSSQPAQIYEPGTTVAYSNYGASLAGYIVERVSGMPFYAYVQKNIFAPLGIGHTALRADLSDNEWVKAQRAKLACYAPDGARLNYPAFCIPLYPAGMATGTIEDFCRFAQALTAAPGSEYALFEKEETRALFYSPTRYFPGGVRAENCHGMWVTPYGAHEMLGHGGNTAGCSAQLCFDPKTGEGMVVMTNQSGEGVYCSGLYEKLYGKLGEAYQAETGAAPDAKGVYMSSRTVKKGTLKLYSVMGLIPVMQKADGDAYIPGMPDALVRIAPDVYIVNVMGARYPFYADVQNGRVEKLSMMSQDYLRVDGGEALVMLLSLLLYVVSFFYALVMLIVSLVRRIRKKSQPLGGLRALCNGAVALSFLSLAALVVTLLCYISTKAQVMAQSALFLPLAVVPVIFALAVLLKAGRLDKKARRGLSVNALMGLVMTFNVIYWQMYMFWA